LVVAEALVVGWAAAGYAVVRAVTGRLEMMGAAASVEEGLAVADI
jgi:hypothetical protein